jgi:hypothetical protein
MRLVKLLPLLCLALACQTGAQYVSHDGGAKAGAGGAKAGASGTAGIAGATAGASGDSGATAGDSGATAGASGAAGDVAGAAGATAGASGGSAGAAGATAGASGGTAGASGGSAGAGGAVAGAGGGTAGAGGAAGGVMTCPADKPVLDNGVCCPTGQRNCGGTCVACAPGSVCAGNTCACPASSQCAPAVPSGWLGPVAADLTGGNAACGAAYPTSIAAGTGPQGGAAACSCTCGACAGGSCTVYYDAFSTSDCSGPADGSAVIGSSINDCNTSTPNGSLYNIRGVASKTGASCGVTKGSVNAPAPSWGTNTRLCTGATVTPGACTGGNVCAPLTAPKKTCIYHTGAMACPTGSAYSVSSTQYTTFSDSRDCSCACNPSTATCAPVVSFIDTTAGCTGDTGTTFTQCGSVFLGSTHGFRINSLNVSVTGTTSYTSSGSVAAASPLTVCCTN